MYDNPVDILKPSTCIETNFLEYLEEKNLPGQPWARSQAFELGKVSRRFWLILMSDNI